MQDANWNVTGLANGSGTVVERYVYDSFGAVTYLNASWSSIGSSAYGWQYLFQGSWRDGTTGLDDRRSRWYSPPLGRWLNMDPIRYQAEDNNLYRFVKNRPSDLVDPFGLRDEPPKKDDPPKYKEEDFTNSSTVLTAKDGTKLVIYFYKPGNHFMGVIYRPKGDPVLFGKCVADLGLNVQIPYYKKDDPKNGDLEKIVWYNVGAKDGDAQKAVSKRFEAVIKSYPLGGKDREKFVKLIIDQEVEKGTLLKDKTSIFTWPSKDSKDYYPDDKILPPIPPEPKPEK
jgi:RHS repeat-associated protein